MSGPLRVTKGRGTGLNSAAVFEAKQTREEIYQPILGSGEGRMRIAIDASSSAVANRTGVAKYILRLIEYLERQPDDNEYLVYYRLSRWKKRQFFYHPLRETTKVKLLQEPFCVGRGIDVFHGPDARLPGLRRPKLVATVHDVFSLVSDEFAKDEFRKKKIARYRTVAERADRIICVSENTRRDFLRFFSFAEARTCVIGEGVDEQFFRRPKEEVERVKKKFGITSDYLLYVGALSKRKNVLRMFEAFKKAREKFDTELQFVAVGRLTYGKEEISKYIEDTVQDNEIVLTGYVPDEDVPALYSGARLFVFTTLYEGFGLPILEALACGAPVLTSNISAMPEVGGDNVIMADPRDVDDIKEKMLACLQKSCLGNAGEQETDAVGRFSWSRMARETSKTYAEVCGKT
jgi:glycosyltransferase involved in cell wall biosynthesis